MFLSKNFFLLYIITKILNQRILIDFKKSIIDDFFAEPFLLNNFSQKIESNF